MPDVKTWSSVDWIGMIADRELSVLKRRNIQKKLRSMNIIKELHESSTLKAETFCSTVTNDNEKFDVRLSDLKELLSIAEEHDIALWQVVAVATTRLRKDIAEHRQQILMGI